MLSNIKRIGAFFARKNKGALMEQALQRIIVDELEKNSNGLSLSELSMYTGISYAKVQQEVKELARRQIVTRPTASEGLPEIKIVSLTKKPVFAFLRG